MIKIRNEANAFTMQVFEPIGNYTDSTGKEVEGFTIGKLKAFVATTLANNITIEFKSLGGDVFEAFAMYDYIKMLKQRVTVDIIGSSASAITVVAAAADRVRITVNSRYLVHNAQTFVEGNKEDLLAKYEQLESVDNQILDVYVKRTGKNRDLLANLMTEERWMTAQEALEWGFVDEIINVEQKVTNKMEKFKNLTEEEKAEMDQLIADKEALLAKVAELEAKLAEYETAQAEKDEEEVEAAVTAAVSEGKIKAEAADNWKKVGKADKAAMFVALASIVKSGPVIQVNQPKVENKKDAPKARTKDDVWADFKAGKIQFSDVKEQLKSL